MSGIIKAIELQSEPEPRRRLRAIQLRALAGCLAVLLAHSAFAAQNVYLLEVPDYDWWRGCFGTATGNLMGFWDRHGFPDFYTGPTAGGVAPLNNAGENAGIRSLWASKAGLDGRPANQPGHEDDYWVEYQSTAQDPHAVAGRPEHPPDCLGDFIGMSQRKWTNLDNECDGNIDGFSYVYWDHSGARRVNFVPGADAGEPARDLQSGLLAWTRFRGYACEVFTQLTDFNPAVPAGAGFTFADLKREIDSGYPVLLFLQHFNERSRDWPGMPRANPFIHGMLAHGYYVADDGRRFVRYKTSWGGSGENSLSEWSSGLWQADLPIRGVIGFHPQPRIRQVKRNGRELALEWDGPASRLYSTIDRAAVAVHRYVVERSDTADPDRFVAVTEPSTERTATLPDCCDGTAFFRVKLLAPETE